MDQRSIIHIVDETRLDETGVDKMSIRQTGIRQTGTNPARFYLAAVEKNRPGLVHDSRTENGGLIIFGSKGSPGK